MSATLFLGASGYIGGTYFLVPHDAYITADRFIGAVLVGLIKDHPDVTFTTVVRSEVHVDAISSTVAIAVMDSLADYEALAVRVSESDVVVNCANSSDVLLITPILQGFKKRFEQGKGVGTLIHTSGAANFIDSNKEGKFDPSAKIWTVCSLVCI